MPRPARSTATCLARCLDELFDQLKELNDGSKELLPQDTWVEVKASTRAIRDVFVNPGSMGQPTPLQSADKASALGKIVNAIDQIVGLKK